MRVAIAADHGGYDQKGSIADFIRSLGHEVIDFGPFSPDPVDYPDYADKVARAVSRGDADRGVLLCGTGLGMAITADKVPGVRAAAIQSIEFAELFREHNDGNVVCMSGRFHTYEGYDFEQLVIPVRLFKLLGVKATILTNAAGAVNVDYHPGDIMIVSDHIKLSGHSPLRGRNVEEFGPRFFDVSRMYTPELRAHALKCAEGTDLIVHEGVYYFFTGPQFETPAEIRAVRILGADAVGMSTVTEALTAAHCGMPLLCLSVMTNMAAGVLDRPLTDGEVDETAKTISTRFAAYVRKIIGTMDEVQL